MNDITQNPKTSIAAIVGGLAWLLAKFGLLVITPDLQNTIVMVTVFIIGLLAKDGSRLIKPQQPPSQMPPSQMPPGVNPYAQPQRATIPPQQ